MVSQNPKGEKFQNLWCAQQSEKLEKEIIVFRFLKGAGTSERAVLGKGSILPPGLSHLPCRPLQRVGMDFAPSFGEITQHTATRKQSPPSPQRRGRGDRQLWIMEVGSHTLGLAQLEAFSSRGYGSRLVTDKLPVQPLQPPLTPDS